jgi:hypothetical protein
MEGLWPLERKNIAALLRLELSVIMQELCAGGHNYHRKALIFSTDIIQPSGIFSSTNNLLKKV